MQYTTYSRQFVSILALFGVMVFSGAYCIGAHKKGNDLSKSESVDIFGKKYTSKRAPVGVKDSGTLPDPDQKILEIGDKGGSGQGQWGSSNGCKEPTFNLPVANSPAGDVK